jgi:protein phosphatase
MEIIITAPSLIILLGVSGSGKSTFAKQHFAATQIVSSDFCRALICDDENDQSVNQEAFELLHWLVAKRLALRKLTVVDATNVKATSRQPLLDLAKSYDVPAIAIVFNFDLEFCLHQNSQRTHRVVPTEIIAEQFQELQTSIPMLAEEGFQHSYVLSSQNQMNLSIESEES